ncbi:MAG: hypothetical protein SVY15_00295 [Halobacteriota archaeon]|nr:hypothetical protein [Halobacteriota archaeon]
MSQFAKPTGFFDNLSKIMNSQQSLQLRHFFWPEPNKALKEILCVLMPDGKSVLEMAYNKEDGLDHTKVDILHTTAVTWFHSCWSLHPN